MQRPGHCAVQQKSPSNITKKHTCHEQRHWRRLTPGSLQHYQILLLPRNCKCNIWLKIRDLLLPIYSEDPSLIRPCSSFRTRPFAELTRPILTTHFSWKIATVNISCSGYLPKFHDMLRLPQKVTFQHHCNFTKYCACHEKWHCNFTKYIAPATKNDADAWSSWKIKRAVHCANKMHPPMSPNIFACHEKTLQHLYSILLLPTLTSSPLLYSDLPYSTLLYTLLYPTPLFSTLLYSILL